MLMQDPNEPALKDLILTAFNTAASVFEMHKGMQSVKIRAQRSTPGSEVIASAGYREKAAEQIAQKIENSVEIAASIQRPLLKAFITQMNRKRPEGRVRGAFAAVDWLDGIISSNPPLEPKLWQN